ncbi:DNA repair helicase [Staphylococcus phage Madawaska]|nr:DNA repair helicase [Staphylococcus phage Madawaska]
MVVLNETRKIKVSVYPTRILVENYELGFCSAVENYLSVWDKIYHKHTYKAFKYDEENKTISFPAGINTKLLLQSLKNHGEIDYQDFRAVENLFFKPKPNYDVKMNFKPRDLLQRKAIEFLNSFSIYDPSTQKFLSLQTGEGKTFCALKSVIDRELVPMIFVNNNKLKEQWEEKIKEYTNVDDEKIYVIQGRASINKLFKMKSKERNKIDFYIVMYKTLNSFIQEDEERLQELLLKTKVGIKIFDEAHLDFRSLTNIDIQTDLPSIYLSATPRRSDKSENMVFSNIFLKTPIFSSDNYDRQIANNRKIPSKYHDVFIIRWNSNPKEVELADFMKASKRNGLNVNHYSKYLIEEDKRRKEYFDIVFNIINNAIMKEEVKKTVVMFKLKNMIDDFYSYLEDKLGPEGLEFLNCIRYYDGIDKEEKDKVLESNLIITTDLSLGTGIDIPDLKAVINTVPLSSESKVTQIMGRLRYIENEKLMFFDLIDHGFKKLVSQGSNRLRNVYKKKALNITDFKIK